jgi:hypothetical protein
VIGSSSWALKTFICRQRLYLCSSFHPTLCSHLSGGLRTSQTRILLIVIRICNSNNFCYWCYKSTSTIL